MCRNGRRFKRIRPLFYSEFFRFLGGQYGPDYPVNGFVRIDNAFSRKTAAEVVDVLWKDLPCDRNEPATWTQPVVRLGMYSQEPFIKSANTTALHSAYDQLVGTSNWLPPNSMGTFPVRFPSSEDPGDTGWHVDASFPGKDVNNFFDWRINFRSKGRGLLMLFLYSDIGENDAPTRIRIGSHLDVARLLKPEGEAGLSFMELAGKLDSLTHREEVFATGSAGTVYLCHPFLVHSAQAHRGEEPRFLAQPGLVLRRDLEIESVVERSIKLGSGSH